MAENKLNKEVINSEIERINKIKSSLDKLINKKSKILFSIPESENPSASVYELYFHAKTVKDMGYDVIILVEKNDYNVPTWIESELTDIKHISMTDSKLTVSAEDILIIPEVYSNVMEQTKNLPCMRVGFLQSFDYMLNALIPGTDWSSFGIKNIIVTSEALKENVEMFYGKNKFNIFQYNIGIPDYFKKSDKLQKPIISILGRNPNEISKFVKLFYSKYPQYSWVTFDPMLTKSNPPKQMSRTEFAKRLSVNFAGVWIDRISSFGTFPLECMKVGTIPIYLKPDITPEYLIERGDDGKPDKYVEDAGIWTTHFYELPMLVAETLVKFLDDSIKSDFYVKMDEIASKYSQDNSTKQIIEMYNNIIENRITLFNNVISDFDKNEE